MPSILEKTKDLSLIIPYIIRVFPQVDRELSFWKMQAKSIPNEVLRKQALDSIASKRFHCQGGSIYALYTHHHETDLIRYIVALQTISDYLDNLSDRVAGTNESNLRMLHHAILAAVDLNEPICNWYECYPHQGDNGYLDHLVQVCRQTLPKLAGYQDVQRHTRHLMQLYTDLQVYKHLDVRVRAETLVNWFIRHKKTVPDIYWWEFAAACGSTLGVFALMSMAAAGPVKDCDIAQMLECYFPWLCGTHILLDYFIDLDEDREYNDLNFVSFYPTTLSSQKGMLHFLQETLQRVEILPRQSFHRAVAVGLLALYLSDSKAFVSGRSKISQQLLRYAGSEALWLHRLCLLLRKNGTI